MQKFVCLLRGPATGIQSMGPDEKQTVFQRHMAWRQSMAERGLLVGGHKLEDGTGRLMKGNTVSDGPFVESKEVIGGLYVIQANDYDHAVELASTCPHLDIGPIEVRAVDVVSGKSADPS